MAATRPQGIQIVGTDASPIALGANGGGTDVWTWTHNFGRRARKVEVLTITSRQPTTPASVVVTQPTVNSIVLTNTTVGALDVVIEVTWEYPSSSLQAPEPASVGVLS